MDYLNAYIQLIIKHGTASKPKAYSERHHIHPLSLGGSNDNVNLVYLSARCHFIAHVLLLKIHRNAEMARALFGMCDSRVKGREGLITAKRYDLAKKAFSKYNHMKLPEHRLRSSISAKAQWNNNYEEMCESNAWMFNAPEHPMYMLGKTGDAHPRSRAVITPLGRFGSVRDAGRAYGINHSEISSRCKSKLFTEFFYEDGGC